MERERREAAGLGGRITDDDLYPDARPALAGLRAQGLWVGIAGNQTARAAELLRARDLPVDAVATSDERGAAKPDLEFFERVARFAPGRRDEIAYVGDHRDNDVIPAHAAGFRTVLIRRGPWGHLWADDPVVRRTADWVIDSLTELPALVGAATRLPTE